MGDVKEIKKIPIKEFRELGYLQELNREFLHPIGMALEVVVNEDGTESLGGVWDYRDDPEGMRFDYANPEFSPPERVEGARGKAARLAAERVKKAPIRMKALGFWIEPIPE